MNDRGWIFADVLVAMAVLTIALAYFLPAFRGVDAVVLAEERRIQAAMEIADDPWKDLR